MSAQFLSNSIIFIPCRRNSKGVPFKNRKLFRFTIDAIPPEHWDNILVSTDDECIIEKCKQLGLSCLTRSANTCGDTASTKAVMIESLPSLKKKYIIMLYLTYPERTWDKVVGAIAFYEDNNARSMLCRKTLKTSPYLMMHREGLKGRQLIKHDLYRRQDYPECFEISHYVAIMNTKEINNLNNNLYNGDTFFYPIDSVIDIDTESDMENFNATNKNNS